MNRNVGRVTSRVSSTAVARAPPRPGGHGRRDGLPPRNRAAARRFHHGLLSQRPGPTHRPRLPRLHLRLHPRTLEARLPIGRKKRRVAGNLPGEQAIQDVRDSGDDRGAFLAVGVRVGRIRERGRSRGEVGDAASVLAVVSDSDGEYNQWVVSVLGAGEGAGAVAVYG